MRVFVAIIVCLCCSVIKAQPPRPRETCEWIAVFIKSAINGFQDANYSSAPVKSYEKDYEMDGVYKFEEFDTRFLWPGAVKTYLEISTSDNENEQTRTLVSPYTPEDTREKAYVHFKKVFNELVPCTVTPLPGQKAYLKGVLPPLLKAMEGFTIMDAVFTVPGTKKGVRILLDIREADGKYITEMQVVIRLFDNEVIVSKCNDLQQVINQLSSGFSGQVGKLNFSKDLDMTEGVVSERRTYDAKKDFPGSSGTWIENSRLKKNGKLKTDNWSLQAWYSAYSFQQGVERYRRLFNQLNECSVKSPSGRSIKLSGEYKAPTPAGGNFIDFKTSTDSDPFFISISFEKEDNRYFIWLKVSQFNKKY